MRTVPKSQAWDAINYTTPPRQSTQLIALTHLVKTFGRQPGVVLSDINPVYLNALLPDPFVAPPLDEKRYLAISRIWRYDRVRAVALVKQSLAQSLAVYALFVSRKEMDEKVSRLPVLDGYEWVVAENPTAEAAILKLSPSSE